MRSSRALETSSRIDGPVHGEFLVCAQFADILGLAILVIRENPKSPRNVWARTLRVEFGLS